MARSNVFIALVLTITVKGIKANEETMRSITSSFLKVLDECKHELSLGDHVLGDLYHFWKEESSLVHRDTGCAIVCMSKKLELLDTSGKLHHGNAQEFAVKNGAAEEVATKLVALVHGCEQQHEAIEDECLRALDVAKCFRDSLRGLDWAPKMEVAQHEAILDECLRALDVAKCFCGCLRGLDWAPKIDVAVGEVLTEM